MGTSAFDRLKAIYEQPKSPEDRLRDIYDEPQREDTARVRSLVNGVQHSPDQAAEAVTLSKRMGVPADVALRNLDPLRQMASVAEFDADTFVRENPATSRWLQGDPIRPALAKDDFESLTALERITGRGTVADRFLQGFANLGLPASRQTDFTQRVPSQRGTIAAAFGAGRGQIEESVLYGQFRAEERRNPAVQAQIAAARARQVALPEPTGLFEESLRSAVSGFLPSMLFVAGEALEGAAIGGASGAALGAIGGPTSGLTAGVGASVGGKVAGYNAYRLLMTGELAKSLEEAKDANGLPIPDEIQDRVALAGGAGLALLGMYGFDKAVGILGVGARNVASRVVAMGVAKSLATRTAARVGLDIARVYGTSVAFETAQEVTEQAGLIAAESVARQLANAEGMDFGPVENVTAELGETAVQTFLGALWFGGVGAVGAGAVGMARVQKAQEDGDQLAEAIGIADASKLRQRDPDAFESVVAEQVRGSGKENLSVDGERLQILLQEQGVPLDTFASEMGLDVKDFASRIAQGGDVMLPTAKVLARLTGTDLITPMADILKWRPDGLAPVEARELAATIEKEGAAIAKELEGEMEVAKGSPEERVLSALTAQITDATKGLPKSAQFTPENIEAEALLFTKMYRIAAMAEGKGRDAFQLYQEKAPRFLSPATAEPLYNAMVEARKLEKSGKKPERLAELRSTIATLSGRLPSEQVTKLEQAAFHGTPYIFDRFDLSKIGTGEGAQSYGWGAYFAENQSIAEGYRKNLTQGNVTYDGRVLPKTAAPWDGSSVEDIALLVLDRNGRDKSEAKKILRHMASNYAGGVNQSHADAYNAAADLVDSLDPSRFGGEGALYRVDLPDEAVARMLDWDAPFTKQAKSVKDALKSSGIYKRYKDNLSNFASPQDTRGSVPSGARIVAFLEWELGSAKAASEALLAAGIPGTKYLDAGSRDAGKGSRNLVVFNENLVTITHRNGEPVTAQERTDFLAQSPSLPETLDIDGVARPTRNSTGQPIHPTEEGVRNFWRWATEDGREPIVDANGFPEPQSHSGTFDESVDPVPMVGREGFHVGTQKAAESRQIGKPVDDFIREASITQDEDTGRWFWSSQNVDSFDFDEDGFASEQAARTDLHRSAQEYVGNEVEFEEQALTQVYVRARKQLRTPDAGSDWTAVVEKAKADGYDGISYINRFEDKGSVSYIVFDGRDMKSVANFGEFGPTANILRQGANAFIIPGVSQRTIGLMPTANLSSVLHEMAHDFLFVYRDLAAAPDASPAVKSAYAEMLKAIGAEDGVLTEAAQEKFARGFERRLQDGKAPSRALMRAYVRFQSWMTRIYRLMTEKLVPISPELRDVFDRMVATEEELAEVRGEIGSEPMFSDAEAELLGEEAVARYQAKVELRTAEEQGTLLKRLLAERSDEYRKVKAEREKVIRSEVEAEVAERPVYQALRSITGKDAPKLDLADLEAQFGDGVRATLPKAITASEGTPIPVDAVALQFGFRDGTALVASLQDARVNTEKREVSRIVADRMREEFPDPMESSVVMRDEAQKAAHVGETDDVLLDELKFLGKLAGIRPRGNQAVTLEAVRKVARDTMAKERVRDIRPIVYANAEARAATKSGQAMKKGDYAEAEKYKRQQMVQHILYREAVKALEMAEKVRKFASRMDKAPAQERLGKAGKSYQDAMNALLDAYEFRDLSRPQMAEKERLRAQVAAWAEEVALAYTVETDDGKVSVIEPYVSEALLASPMNYRELTAGRVQELYDAMKQVYHTATALDKEMRAKRAMLFSERVELLVDTAEINWTPDQPKFIQSQGLMDRLSDNLDAKHGEMIKVEMLARLLDGDKPNGPWQEALTNYAAESQAEFNRDMEQFTARYKAAMNLIPKDRIKGFFTQLVNVPNVAGQGTENPRMTGQQVFHLLLNYGNESSRAAVNAGEFSNGYHPYSDANAKKLFALLTPEEMQAAQEIWDAVSMFWDQIAEMNREMTGITPKKVSSLPVTLLAVDGSEVTLKGGYFPLKYDTRFSAKAYQQEQSRAEATAQGLVPFLGSATSSTERGHLIERQDANGRIVDLSPEVVARHMSASVYDLTHRRMVYDVQKLVLDPRIADIVQRTAGRGAYRKALLPWARRLAGEKGPPQTWVAKMALRARAGASTMGLGFRATTIMLQYLGLGQVMALIGPKYTARGFREIQKYKKGAFEAADALAPEVAYRQLSFNRDLTEMARNMKADGKWNAVYETAFAGIAFMDRQVSVAGFWGGYYQWLDANPTDVAGAVQAGEQAVRLSQGASNAKDLAQLMASNDPLTRTLTSFFSNGSVLYQLFWRASRQVKGKQSKAAFLTSLLGAWIVPAVLEPLMRGRMPEDDDDIEDKIAWWFWQITSYPMQAIPLARDLARMLEPGSKFGKEFAPPFLRPFTELGKSLISVADIAGDGELDAKDIEQFLKTLGYWANAPLDAPWGMSERLYQWMTGEVAPDNVLEGGRFVLTNAPIQ